MTSTKELDNPITLQLRNGKTHLTCCLQSLHSMNLEYDLASQKRKSIATEQWPSRCSSIRTDPSHQALHPKWNYLLFSDEIDNSNVPINQISTQHNQSEIMIRSPETIVINNNCLRTIPYPLFQLPGATDTDPSSKSEKRRCLQLLKRIPSSILHYIKKHYKTKTH